MQSLQLLCKFLLCNYAQTAQGAQLYVHVCTYSSFMEYTNNIIIIVTYVYLTFEPLRVDISEEAGVDISTDEARLSDNISQHWNIVTDTWVHTYIIMYITYTVHAYTVWHAGSYISQDWRIIIW